MVGMNNVLRGAIPLVLALVVIGLILGVGSQVVQINQDLYDTKDANVVITNESLTIAVNTEQNLANNFVDNTTIVVTNASGTLAQARWWNNATGSAFGLINFNILDTADGELVNVSYTYESQNKDAAFNATVDGLSGLTTFSSFQPTFAVIIVAVLIIILITMGFAAVVVGRRVV